MTSLIDVLDTRDLLNKKKQFNKYLFETPCELSHLEKAYFKVLYDIYFISEMENEAVPSIQNDEYQECFYKR